ncbi:putative disease resistance protein At1g50180 isoform X2 [Telopea speciosissima]|uniref:putative disease resistance protein At1g50180 isoform X1 n=1 Tax=Telopea speciosissima TaxID=54955 RepID=UPI001CC4603C|nr:putative disease resistance protein At1g50180 isoform X1 [Telopea speciosissima]XP_043707671.1 putative disease resistance protein At1g50180 isoform X2 [Telopea speciosissima]
MAESIITFFIEKLSDLITREANFLTGVDEQIDSLRNELEWMRSFMKDADGRCKDNERARLWVNQVRSISYDAENVIDEFIFKVERQRQRERGIGQLKLLHDLGNEIEKIKKRIEEVSANKSKYGIETLQFGEPSSSSQQSSSSRRQRRTPVVVEEVDVVGIEDEAEKLVRQLIQGEPQLSIVSIVGMGGLGKTTLAKKVYNCNDVSRHFECHAWIYVSQEYNIRELLEGLLDQVVELNKKQQREVAQMTDHKLQRELFGYLKERRYLVVVDDIWNEEAWDSLKAVLPEATTGSRVMVTTRNKEVALHADMESLPHELRFLSEEECWTLFCKKALPKNVPPVLSPELQKVGRDIVAKCGGLPLAVVVLGGLLSREDRIPSEWAKVLKRINGKFCEGHDQITRILALSYDDLPYHLKSCFLYLGVFPEDHEIPARKLIQLWVAEGLVQQRGNETMEEVAEDYLEELIGRSMVQSSRRSSVGIKTCRIHDMLRNLSISEAMEDKFLDIRQIIDFESPVRAHRLIVYGDLRKYISLNHNCPTRYLRSIFCHNTQLYYENFSRRHWRFLCGGFRLLRVLDLPQLEITELPHEIGEMIHLRFLGLRGNYLTSLPTTICNLINLQTLDIKPTYALAPCMQDIPNAISEMDQLRHLHMNWGRILGPSRIENLRNLQTLSEIEAGSWIEDGLAQLTNLRKLVIRGVFNSHREALLNSIVHLENLQSLCLSTCTFNDDKNILPTLIFSNHVHLYKLQLLGRLEKLPNLHEFPQNITHLNLQGSCLMQDPMATLEKLPHLRTLVLCYKMYRGKILVCSTGGFRELQELELIELTELEEWRVEEGAMSSIKRVKLFACLCLKMLPEGFQYMTTLKELELILMQAIKARILPENVGEDWYKIQHVPLVVIKDSYSRGPRSY